MRLSGHKRITSLEHYDPGNSLEIKSKMASALMLVPKSSTNSTQYLEKRRLDLEQQKLNIIEAQNKQIMKINSFLFDKFEKSL